MCHHECWGIKALAMFAHSSSEDRGLCTPYWGSHVGCKPPQNMELRTLCLAPPPQSSSTTNNAPPPWWVGLGVGSSHMLWCLPLIIFVVIMYHLNDSFNPKTGRTPLLPRSIGRLGSLNPALEAEIAKTHHHVPPASPTISFHITDASYNIKRVFHIDVTVYFPFVWQQNESQEC